MTTPTPRRPAGRPRPAGDPRPHPTHATPAGGAGTEPGQAEAGPTFTAHLAARIDVGGTFVVEDPVNAENPKQTNPFQRLSSTHGRAGARTGSCVAGVQALRPSDPRSVQGGHAVYIQKPETAEGQEKKSIALRRHTTMRS